MTIFLDLQSFTTRHTQISIETGPVIACVAGTTIPKFGMVGTAVDHAGVIILHVTGDSIIVGPTTRSCLPAMYKVKHYYC